MKIFTQLAMASCLLTFAGIFLGCSVARDYDIADGSTHRRSYTSVAGGINIGSQSTIRNAKTVAGNIDARRGSSVGNLTSVAGTIRLEPEVAAKGSISTVAGDIDISERCVISGKLSTVAGAITLRDSQVYGDIHLRAGSVNVSNSQVGGTIRAKKVSENDTSFADITISEGSKVTAIVAEKGSRATLRIHRSAKVGAISGIEPEYFGDEL